MSITKRRTSGRSKGNADTLLRVRSAPYLNADAATARCRLLSIGTLRGAVWEVRTSLANRIARTLFAVESRQMMLLHGFIKKTQQTPNDDIKLAEKRFKEWQRGET